MLADLLHHISLFRVCQISGRYGGGKTSLSVLLALDLVKSGKASSIVSNVPFSFTPACVVDRHEAQQQTNAVLLIDEAWLELGQGVDNRKIRDWLAYLRKLNQYVLLPSVLPLAKIVSTFSVEREYSFSPIGIPLWVYRWRLNIGASVGKKDNRNTGRVYWWRPGRVFPFYDHTYRPDDNFYVYKFD